MNPRNTQYRVVTYAPNPFGGDRITVGAVIRLPDGTVQQVGAPDVPPVECIGSLANRAHFLLARKLLCKVVDFERLPAVFGPQILWSEPIDVPEGKPESVVAKLVFSDRAEPHHDDAEHPRQSRKRAAFGREYFRNKGIHRDIVKSNYRPTGSKLAPPITHYVESADQLLLLEPLSPLREEKTNSDLSVIFERFHAYNDILRGANISMTAYLLPGFPQQRVIEAREGLAEIAEVVDLGQRKFESEFLEKIRALAKVPQRTI